ncbi:MAG: 4Fe-4S dicluster domain-containing protein [Firmicutes bacterium]|nr:4Fe-4S dicluster domain-containing protein [Bacillota bacterium]
MDARVVKKERLPELLDRLARETVLIAPVREEETVTLFKIVSGGHEVELNYTNSDVPPKAFFFPQTEKMFSFRTTGGTLEIQEANSTEKMVLFGVRPCDVKSLEVLDPVFNGKYKDNYYAGKRENSVIIGLSCPAVLSTCFCKAFDSGPCDGRGTDLMFTDVGDQYFVEINTPKGLSLVEANREYFSEQGVAGAAGGKEAIEKELSDQFYRVVDLKGVKEILDRHFELPYWEKISKKCLGCGICTFICPTCHCFDIFDHMAGDYAGDRFRCWDSCMFQDFTLMAGGHNPRPTKKERVRNRFMHKLKYHLDRYGVNGCVGCGRCIVKCPVNMDITEIIKDLREVGKNE